jgi:hypothetical protein
MLIGSALTAAIVSAAPVIYAQHTARFFIGYDDCLVLEDQEVTVGTTLMALAVGQPPRGVIVGQRAACEFKRTWSNRPTECGLRLVGPRLLGSGT